MAPMKMKKAGKPSTGPSARGFSASRALAVSKKPRARAKPASVNTEWLKARMKAEGFTEKTLGKQLGLDAPTTHRLLTGDRRLKLEELSGLATALRTSVEELLGQFGVDIAPEGVTSLGRASKLILSGVVDGTLAARLGENWVRGAKTIPCPFATDGLRALRFETTASPYSWLDGQILFYRPTDVDGAGIAAMAGKIALVKLWGREDWCVRVIRRGYRGVGFYTLEDLAGKALETDVRVESAREIAWIRIVS